MSKPFKFPQIKNLSLPEFSFCYHKNEDDPLAELIREHYKKELKNAKIDFTESLERIQDLDENGGSGEERK